MVTNGVATLPSAYIDPQHDNLLNTFSRFLVTELAVINQLNDLCHLRHLLSGDPELAMVNLSGGSNYWLQNNVKEIQKWSGAIVNSDDPGEIRHKGVDILYMLDGRSCIAQDLLQDAPNQLNSADDANLAKTAAIPLLNCAIPPNMSGYLAHIQHHLNALVISPGAMKEQVALANEISPEINSINALLVQVQYDARHLVALDDSHLTMTEGKSLRNDMDMLARIVLNGGIDPGTGKALKGVISVADQIQQLSTMDISRY